MILKIVVSSSKTHTDKSEQINPNEPQGKAAIVVQNKAAMQNNNMLQLL